MRHRAYHFVSHWHISAPKSVVTSALLRDEDWLRWWKGLEQVVLLSRTSGASAQFMCMWRSASGYRIRLIITITEYVPGERIQFTSIGDLEGQGTFVFAARGPESTDITIYWEVQTTKLWMNLLAPLLRSHFILNHDKLMAAGEHGLQAYLQTKQQPI